MCDILWLLLGGGAPTEVMIRFPLVSTRGFTASPMLYNQKSYTQKMFNMEILKKHSLEKIFLFWKYMFFKDVSGFVSQLLRDVKQSVHKCCKKSPESIITRIPKLLEKSHPEAEAQHHQHPTQHPQPSIKFGDKNHPQPSIHRGWPQIPHRLF